MGGTCQDVPFALLPFAFCLLPGCFDRQLLIRDTGRHGYAVFVLDLGLRRRLGLYPHGTCYQKERSATHEPRVSDRVNGRERAAVTRLIV